MIKLHPVGTTRVGVDSRWYIIAKQDRIIPPDIAMTRIVGEPEVMWNREAAAAVAEEWMLRYLRAWESNDPDDIRSLFTQDAEYRDGPATPPWVGQDAIVAGWLGQKDDPGTWSFEYELTAVDRDVAVIRGRTTYPGTAEKARRYDNLMVIQFDEAGRARSFTDWWVVPAATESDD